MANLPRGFKVALLASDENIRLAAAAVLTTCSYEVLSVASVEECLQLFTVRRIDIVLAESSDLNVENAQSSQLMTVLKNIPLIIMSGNEAPGPLFHGMKIGAVDFLKRPLEEAKVRSIWTHTLNKRLTSTTVASDEGPSHQQVPRRVVNDDGVEGSVSRDQVNTGSKFAAMISVQSSLPSEGSSTDPKSIIPSVLDPGKRVLHRQGDPTTTAEVSSRPSIGSVEVPNTSSSPLPTQLSSMRERMSGVGMEPQKRSLPTPAENSRRRIRPNLMNREPGGGASSSAQVPSSLTGGASSSTPMNVPPLLGIPPGCVPPVGSNGLAIGMPFLNQHPFVPANPMNLNTFSLPTNPFLFGGQQDLTGASSTPLTGTGQTPIPPPPLFDSMPASPFSFLPSRPSAPVGMVPTSVATVPARSSSLPHVNSTPAVHTNVNISQAASGGVVQTTQGNNDETSQSAAMPNETQDPDIVLRKSPSLINF